MKIAACVLGAITLMVLCCGGGTYILNSNVQWFNPESPTLGRMGQLSYAIWENRDRLTESTTIDDLEAMAPNRSSKGRICDIKLTWLANEPGLMRAELFTNFACIEGAPRVDVGWFMVVEIRTEPDGSEVGWWISVPTPREKWYDPDAPIESQYSARPLHEIPEPALP